MNISYFIFLFLWIGFPIICTIAFVVLLVKKIKYKKAIKSGLLAVNDSKVNMNNILFVVTTVFFIVSSSLSIGLFIILSMAVAHM